MSSRLTKPLMPIADELGLHVVLTPNCEAYAAIYDRVSFEEEVRGSVDFKGDTALFIAMLLRKRCKSDRVVSTACDACTSTERSGRIRTCHR